MNAETMPAGGLAPDSTYVDVDKVPWLKTRFPGIEAKTARLPLHEHVAIEQTYVLSGSFSDHAGTCTAGNYVWRKAGSRHEAWTDEGCLVLAVFLKPNMFFD